MQTFDTRLVSVAAKLGSFGFVLRAVVVMGAVQLAEADQMEAIVARSVDARVPLRGLHPLRRLVRRRTSVSNASFGGGKSERPSVKRQV